MKKHSKIKRFWAGFLCLTLLLSSTGFYVLAENTTSDDLSEAPSVETEEICNLVETEESFIESDVSELAAFSASEMQNEENPSETEQQPSGSDTPITELAQDEETQTSDESYIEIVNTVEEPVDEGQEPDTESANDANVPDQTSDDPIPAELPEQNGDPNTSVVDEEPVEPPMLDEQAELLTDEEIEVIPQDEAPLLACIGDYVAVTPNTRVFSEVDEDAAAEAISTFFIGYFVSSAVVRVTDVLTDNSGHGWYKVEYLYGADRPKGGYVWTATDAVFVLAEETAPTEEKGCTVTDYAYTKDVLRMMSRVKLRATAMNGFSLKNISGSIGSFRAGQSGLSGSSGKDSDYPQLAKSASHGTIYATPHYLSGYLVYCLEHTLSGPGEGSGRDQTATGPYTLYSMSSYVNDTAAGGLNGVRFSARTMHAIGWIVRHSYPFMVLNRSDSNNETWSRAAGQFAIREVIKRLEGSQYVRSYWNMDSFYSFSNGAPEIYLTYARWLVTNAIDRSGITGKITASNKSVSISGNNYVGSVKLTTDADLIRIPKSSGTITENTGGSSSDYYYIKSGDTIQIISSANRFSITMESISSEDEEAAFLVGVPSASIQKIIVPIIEDPTPYQTLSVSFELSSGSITVTKKSTDGILLKGAEFELLNSTGTVLQSGTTGTNGIVSFPNIAPGNYSVKEKKAPQGYLLAGSVTQNVTVTAGKTESLVFANERITGKVRIVKKDSVTGKPLPGAVFTVTRLTAPASDNASDIGQVVATITTNSNGIAETGILPWGQYRITESTVPSGYLDSGFTTTVTIQ